MAMSAACIAPDLQVAGPIRYAGTQPLAVAAGGTQQV